ncbi:CBS domain containing-hemolysin-like protein [Streptomyces sp. SAI-135]|uniref:hemolysin family protein n=1 Tax=unclassified Streptomyces TaxID=2593676 RepID=UPI002473EF8F|nr:MULTISPECIES: hemolysin family protein [unclassified Streptomyces]MDH6520483.1 CBS domain containing-hemolysin-like protein [Streptomyces sp. SAI-090]MDH6552700.1 CBS domain containing-hemolysin-like protein [Streptomyces sp. SAI-041]MDH6571787.1 CBS domain containing-hemolysin-like protein [Streptomyces sp. SAI-117]MDH6583253.1 CBS domain containing-hemolysin-like protein [Streptomyces sp. SAI-133]MDH6615426.1 CBS domain containing-hemolysin-like protein [Streptomyces sp. SAI-135]
MTIPLLLLGAAFLLILANGFFVAAEFGLVTVEATDAEKAAAEGDRRARRVAESLKELSFQLSGTQLGITITSLVVGMLAEPALAELLHGPFTAVGVPEGAVSGVAVVVGMLLASAVQMVIGELVPKNWAVSKPMQVARFVAGPQHAFARLFRPVIAALNAVANRLVRALGIEPAEELASARTPGELVSLARHSAQAGTLEQDTADLFVRTLSLAELTAQHVMTPRVKVSSLQASATAEDVVNLTRATGLSRFPVYREKIDEIVGMVHLKDALAVPVQDRLRTPVGRIARPALLVPETLPVQPLLARLRSEQPIAVVVDEYGGTAGVVTLEDIVEEIVGEVRDEHDDVTKETPELAAAPPEDGRLAWDADGSCRVDILQRIGLDVPEGPYETVAGLVADLLGRIPAVGDRAELPGWRLTVRQVGHYRAERVRLVRTVPAVNVMEAAR